MSRLHYIPIMLGAASPLALLAACASDVVDLGNDGLAQSLEVGTTCAESPIARGPIEVLNQAQLEGLRGCEEVRGDLHIRIFDGTDLSPLASLRAVTGRFTLGGSPESTAENEDTWVEDEAARQQIAEAGWLTSLHGLESLERVGSLEIERVAAPDLRPLSSLRNVASNDDPLTAGELRIHQTSALVDLAGLENANGVADISIQGNPALESLFGLRVSADVPGFVTLVQNPRLTDLYALAPLEAADYALSIEGCCMEDLDALQGFALASSISIRENPQLIDIGGLAGATFEDLTIEANPRIVNVPEFVNGNNNSRVSIVGNAALASLSLGFTVGFGSLEIEGQEIFIGESWIRISDNPSLALIEVHGNPDLSSLLGITSAQVFVAHRNAALRRIDLGSLRSLGLLSIGDNPVLTELALGDLERADEIAVTNNPELVTTELRSVPSFESTFSGNADE